MSLQTQFVAPVLPEALDDTTAAVFWLLEEPSRDKKDLREAMDILEIAQEPREEEDDDEE